MRRSLRYLVIVVSLMMIGVNLRSQQTDPPFIKYMNHPWVDSVMNTLGIRQRIAQCIWIAAYSGRDIRGEVEVADLIKKYGVGGIIFFQGTPERQAELTNYYQSISTVP